MATISVSTFDEFVSAVAEADAIVNLPENAVWDANDFAPEGILEPITVNCSEINGNGTTIKNLHTYGSNFLYMPKDRTTEAITFNNLFVIDLVHSGNGDCIYSPGDTYIYLNQCGFSCLLGANVDHFIHQKRQQNSGDEGGIKRCSFNIEASSSDFRFAPFCDKMWYCRIQINAPRSTNEILYWHSIKNWLNFSEVIVYAPYMKKIKMIKFSGCTLRGDLEVAVDNSLTGSANTPNEMTVYSADGCPNLKPKFPVITIGVTEEQLRSPAYLRGLGFPIVVS